MKTTLAGPDGNASPGSEQDYPEKLANDLIKGGFAVPVETTSIEPPEKAVMPRAKARRSKE